MPANAARAVLASLALWGCDSAADCEVTRTCEATQPSVSLDATRARWFEHHLTVNPDADTWYVVQVRGDKDLTPIYPDVWPWALTAPIFVDVGGDGYDASPAIR
jgi:hypothetical protein